MFVHASATTLLSSSLLFLVAPAAAAGSQYTVWATSLFHRTGERTPEVLGFIPTTLTSYGAQQVYASGRYFRNRYITSSGSSNGILSAPIQGLSADSINPQQVYVAALDEQWTVASAQAFLQGLYPPYTLNSSEGGVLDPTSILADGTYVESPLGGYQYGQVNAFGGFDPDFPYLGGSLDCPAFDIAASEYYNTARFAATQAQSKHVYDAIGASLLRGILDASSWDYFNAYAIYDYLNYQNAHNASVARVLSDPQYASDGTSYFNQLRWFADQQQWAQLTNLNIRNNYTGSDNVTLPEVGKGSISTIAGNLLAAKMLAQLQLAIETNGTYYKLSALFGDFEPLMALFALMDLPGINSNFYGLPDFGSVAVFELFSYTNGSTRATFPSTDELWVRFYFRNGTGTNNDTSSSYQSYPLFDRGPSQTDMTWNDFQTGMYNILLADIGVWCTQCGATNLFCAAWNSSDALVTTNATFIVQSQMRPVIAGVIGAIVALAVAGLLFALVMLLAGLRFHRVERRSRKSELGGFKGSQKLASDRDLTVPKGGAVVGASIERGEDSPVSPMGHERVGSWELKQAEAGRLAPNMGGVVADGDGRSLAPTEGDELGDPFREPVRPDERV